MFNVSLMLTRCNLNNNNALDLLMNMLTMSDYDDDVVIFVLVMEYFVRKIRSASRIPKQVSTFTGRGQMLDLLAVHDGRFVEILQMPKVCFIRLCGLLEENRIRETRSLTVQE